MFLLILVFLLFFWNSITSRVDCLMLPPKSVSLRIFFLIPFLSLYFSFYSFYCHTHLFFWWINFYSHSINSSFKILYFSDLEVSFDSFIYFSFIPSLYSYFLLNIEYIYNIHFKVLFSLFCCLCHFCVYYLISSWILFFFLLLLMSNKFLLDIRQFKFVVFLWRLLIIFQDLKFC